MNNTPTGLLIFLSLQFSCSKDFNDPSLQGTWIDCESFGFQFIEFYTSTQGRFAYDYKSGMQYDNFTYRLFDNTLTIDFTGDSSGETIHEISFLAKDTIEISGLTDIPENPVKTYFRSNIKTGNENGEIILGWNDTYFDLENRYRLQAYCAGDSRCPEGGVCVWAGYAYARFYLIVDGNYDYTFDLSTIDLTPVMNRDTMIHGITFRLQDITPYPDIHSEIKQEEYKVIVTVEK
jgi:hypothetical protein